MQNNLPKGKLGERLAEKFLIKKGYRIVSRNFRTRNGEVDLIATYRYSLVFIEVKTRWGVQYGTPAEAVTPWKLRSLTRAAEYFKLLHPTLPDAMQIDVVAVELDVTSTLVRLEHLPNVTG